MTSRHPLLLVPALFLALIAAACGDDEESGPEFAFGLDAEVVAGSGVADKVSEIVFAPDGRMFYAEQYKATVRIIGADGTPQPQPFLSLTVANYLDLDWGLTGLALDPDFEDNGYVYIFYTEPAGENIGKPKLVRYTDENGTATDETVISDDFPPTVFDHQGYNANGEIHFGPDGYLYASIGDYDLFELEPELITDNSSPVGKLLRIDKEDGSGPDDNPFADEAGADARVFAYGFREPFAFTFGSDGTIYGNDNTTVSCEELNIIEAGEYYGWPEMGEFPFDDCAAAPGVQAIHHFSREGTAPESFISFTEVVGMAFLEGSAYPLLEDSLIVCESEKSPIREGDRDILKPGVLRRLVMGAPNQVASSEIITKDCKGGLAVHNGEVYYANASEIRKLVVGAAAGDGQQTPPPQQTIPPATQ